jgi:hypothetical protein
MSDDADQPYSTVYGQCVGARGSAANHHSGGGRANLRRPLSCHGRRRPRVREHARTHARERLERAHLFRQAGRANMPFPRPKDSGIFQTAKRAHRCRCRGATGSVDGAAREPIDAGAVRAARARSFPPLPGPGIRSPNGRHVRLCLARAGGAVRGGGRPCPQARARPQRARIYMGRPHTPAPKATHTQTNQQSP